MKKVAIVISKIDCIRRIQNALKSSGLPGAIEVHVGPNDSIDSVVHKIRDCEVIFLDHTMIRFNGEDVAKAMDKNVHVISISPVPALAKSYAHSFLPMHSFPFYPNYEGHELHESYKDYWERNKNVVGGLLKRTAVA